MILQVLSAFDKKARSFLQPFYASHMDVGVRSFKEAANTPEHQVCKHAQDFALYRLGQWDDESGKFELFPQPVHLAEALALKKSEHDFDTKGNA